MHIIVIAFLAVCSLIVYAAVCAARAADDEMGRLLTERRIETFKAGDCRCPLCGSVAFVTPQEFICTECGLAVEVKHPSDLTEAVKAECRKRLDTFTLRKD